MLFTSLLSASYCSCFGAAAVKVIIKSGSKCDKPVVVSLHGPGHIKFDQIDIDVYSPLHVVFAITSTPFIFELADLTRPSVFSSANER